MTLTPRQRLTMDRELSDILPYVTQEESGHIRQCCVCKGLVENGTEKPVYITDAELVQLKDKNITHGYCKLDYAIERERLGLKVRK